MKGISTEVTEDQRTTQGHPDQPPCPLSQSNTQCGGRGGRGKKGTPGEPVIVQAGTELNIYPKAAELI